MPRRLTLPITKLDERMRKAQKGRRIEGQYQRHGFAERNEGVDMAHRGTQRHAEAHRGTHKYTEARRGTQRHTDERTGIQSHTEAPRDTQWHRGTQRNPGPGTLMKIRQA